MADSWQDENPHDLPMHIVGVGGAGMSALAVLLLERGHRVSGSDTQEGPNLERLRKLGIKISLGHHREATTGARVLTASPAVSSDNPEILAAKEAGLVLLTRADIMGWLSNIRSTLAIAGTHGKTTTTAMAITALRAAGHDPSFLLGADLPHTQQRAHWGAEDLLVVEADESYGSFTSMAPAITALSNVEADHLDHYGSAEHLREAFSALLARSQRRLVLGDDPGAISALSLLEGDVVGTQATAQYCISAVSQEGRNSSFVLRGSDDQAEFSLGMPGMHNVCNAALAAAAVNVLG
ncbi:MAG: Mur ligase domain-containing protein, partial [Actinomycetes bacterium]